jgi:uncharacterized protein DUF3854
MPVHGILRLLLSPLYDGALAPEHRATLVASGLTDATVRAQRIRSVPPGLLSPLLGFELPAVRSAMLMPYPDPAGGFMDHIRVKVFPPFRDRRGNTARYLQPKNSGVRLFFPFSSLNAVGQCDDPLWVIEGEKKALAVAQLSLPAIGIAGIEGWHPKGSHGLLPDFSCVSLRGRIVEFVPDSDWRTNPQVARGAQGFLEALDAVGARGRLVVLPSAIPRTPEVAP